MKILLVAIAMMISGSVWANEEKLTITLISCIDKHKASVAKNVVSLEEGAMLFTESLCGDESTAFANFKARIRGHESRPHFLDRYNSEMYVIKRDIRWVLYQEKLKR